MPAVFEFLHRVSADELDAMIQHVNNLAYLKWMQAAAVAHSAAQGWTADRYRELGAGWVVRTHQIEYLQPAFAGDEIVVRTWVADLKKVTSMRRYEILRQGSDAVRETKLAIGATDWAFIHFATHHLKRIPPEVAEAFEIVENKPGIARIPILPKSP
ncbi:MAG: acyl-CoA thioesterase [Planctomycetia bacterium]|nr:acyl-CoA thioesterase [Planctomycetia bacterium]